ncbi:MAG: DUF1538 domain-containing protein, partial [Clostridiaceae bacterium]|nr:DUF1538 domain-containing protein [Clostridiaceae bacterium]
MSLLFEKAKEVLRTLLPVVILVLLLCFTIVEVEPDVLIRFIVGSVLLLVGLSIFLFGVDLSMHPIGEYMSEEMATSKTPIKIALLSFFLGFLITVAEPDLLILGSQVQSASGNVLSSSIIVYMVSIGVGVLILLGVFRLLRDKPSFSAFMAIIYAIILVLVFFVSEEFLAISFDASGATTGALTTPFVLAISLGLSRIKGGKSTEENSFGLVGVMSAGPILAVMLMSIISGQKHIQGHAGEYVIAEGVLGPIINKFPGIFLESLIALLPITILFFIFNFAKFKLSLGELKEIITGLGFTLLGLTIFLTAVYSGFMDMGRIIGIEIGKMSPWILIGIGFLLGLIVVLVEPAVHVLGEQIEEVTSGHIPVSLIRTTLSIGVGTAIALSMVRIVVPQVKLWYFLLPGFFIAILLSFKADPIFVGIAYDAGGVASGPMTATFVLAFAQGAATIIETADVMVDGFGVIAMVAMAPVFSIMVLGTIFRHKKVEYPTIEKKPVVSSHLVDEINLEHDCILVIVNRGFAEKVVDVARQSGAKGATIMRGRGTDENQKVMLPIINIELQPEKEIVWFITTTEVSAPIADSLLNDQQLEKDGEIAVFISPTEAMVRTFTTIQ